MEQFSDIPFEFLIGIRLPHFGNEKNAYGNEKLRIAAKRLPKKAFEVISLYAFSVFLSDAHRHGSLFRGKIYEGEGFAVQAFPRPQDRCDLFRLFQAQVLHRLRGDVLSALISSSFENLSAARRRHSLAESVYFTSLSLFGLVRSFHNTYSLNFTIRFDYKDFICRRQAISAEDLHLDCVRAFIQHF